jgi:hypothetical protein
MTGSVKAAVVFWEAEQRSPEKVAGIEGDRRRSPSMPEMQLAIPQRWTCSSGPPLDEGEKDTTGVDSADCREREGRIQAVVDLGGVQDERGGLRGNADLSSFGAAAAQVSAVLKAGVVIEGG